MTRSIMMLAALIGQMAGEQAWIGEATWTVGTAAVSRGDQNYALQASSGILDGDVLRMPAGAAAGVDLRQQRHVMLAPLTEVVIRNQGAAASLNVAYGEVRGVSAGPLEIQTAQAKVALNSGIVRAKVGPTGTAVWCESGKATIVYDVADRPASGVRSVAARLAQETLVLGAGEAVLIPATGSGAQSIDPGSEAWANFQSLQLRGAAAASRSSKGQYIAGSANSDRSQFQQQMANNQQQQSQQQQSQQEATTTQPAEEPNQDTETTSQTDIAVALGPSLQLGALGSGPSIAGSGGGGADNGNYSFSFPTGVVHVVTAEQAVTVDTNLIASDLTARYWSVATGPDADLMYKATIYNNTPSTDPAREAISVVPVPNTNLFVVDWGNLAAINQDPAIAQVTNDPNSFNVQLFLSLQGNPPDDLTTGGNDNGALDVRDGLLDTAAGVINNTLTYAFGHFRFTRQPNGKLEVATRRSDQDRTTDEFGNNTVANPDVTFESVDTTVFGFEPQVEVPVSYSNLPTSIGQLTGNMRAAFTIATAETLGGYARRTGQTRFVIDGQLIDITGYRPQP